MVRWPGKIKPGSVSNEIVSGHDWLPTLLAAAGEPDIKDKLLKGHEAAGKTFKVHLDGFDQLAYLTGHAEKSPRRGFFYFNDDGDLVAMRYENWKVVFMEQRAPARSGSGPSRSLRFACPSSSTSAPTPTNGPTSPPTPTTTGSSPSLTWLSPRRRRPPSSWPRSRSSHPSTRRELQHRPGRREDEEEPRKRLRLGRGKERCRERPSGKAKSRKHVIVSFERRDFVRCSPPRLVGSGPTHVSLSSSALLHFCPFVLLRFLLQIASKLSRPTPIKSFARR